MTKLTRITVASTFEPQFLHPQHTAEISGKCNCVCLHD